MTPNRRAKIEAMLKALEEYPEVAAFRACGGSVKLAPTTNTARFAGVSSSCTWNEDQHLIEAWIAAARRALDR